MNRKREWALPGRLRARLARLDPWPVWLLLQMTLCWLLLHAISGDSFFGPSYYNTYTLQAGLARGALLFKPGLSRPGAGDLSGKLLRFLPAPALPGAAAPHLSFRRGYAG